MVTAVLAVLVVSSLAVTGFGLATHNLDQSAGERRSIQAVHAAEAGVDSFLRYLSTAPITGTACSLPTETLPTSPASTFTATATYYPDTSGSSPLACPPTTVPGAVLIHSVGTSAGRSRTMEAYYKVTATQGGSTLYNGAVYSDGAATFNGQATMTGNPYGSDLNSNGDVLLGGGGTVYGNVFTTGKLTLKGGTEIKQDAVSKLAFDMSGGSIVRGNGRSSTSSLTTATNSVIYGTAYYCTGSAPGTGSPKTQECNAALPNVKNWTTLQFTYNSTDWSNGGYTIKDFNDPNACTNAKTFIATILSGDYVIRINSTCTLSWAGQDIVNVNGNLAIVSNGSLSMDSHAMFTSTASRKLYLMFNILTPRPCTTAGITFNSQAMVAATLDAMLYTPCTVSFGAQSSTLRGQIIGGQVSFGAGTNITTVPLVIPGPNPNGFQQSMTYRREVK